MMKILNQYLERNKQPIRDIFTSLAKQDELPATKLFIFFQQVFTLETIHITKDQKDYFKDQNNQQQTARVIQQYYRSTPEGQNGKFYLYRILFTYEEVKDYLQYWFNHDTSLQIYDPKYESTDINKQNESPARQKIIIDTQKQVTISKQNLQQQSAQEKKEEKLIQVASLNKQIQQLQEEILKVKQNSEEFLALKQKIDDLQMQKQQIIKQKQKVPLIQPSLFKLKPISPEKSKTQGSRMKKQVNFKLLFQFYAKQNHLTGVKASFQRIQHESQTLNYQKLVHFLKQYDIFPEKPRDQKKLHNLYVRTCSNTRDLHYPQFMTFLQRFPDILIDNPSSSSQQKKNLMMNKIQQKQEKNKLLHNPFHSLEKHDFRTDPSNIKYEFKLKPLKGKFEDEVTNELSSRKKQKQEVKHQHSKEKEQKHIKRLKKLMSIDPYHPQVIKHANLLQHRELSQIQPVASLENMQKFRDSKFDMKVFFGISDTEEDPLKAIVSSQRYQTNKRVQMMEKEEAEKMSILMSGIIQRSEMKLQRLRLSPTKNIKN